MPLRSGTPPPLWPEKSIFVKIKYKSQTTLFTPIFGQYAISNSGMTFILTYHSEKLCIFNNFAMLGFFQAPNIVSFTTLTILNSNYIKTFISNSVT